MIDIHTIELNLDDDFSHTCAYHVADLKETITRNIRHAETSKKTNRWVLVGLANSRIEALEKCEKLRLLLCERNNRKSVSLDELYDKTFTPDAKRE